MLCKCSIFTSPPETSENFRFSGGVKIHLKWVKIPVLKKTVESTGKQLRWYSLLSKDAGLLIYFDKLKDFFPDQCRSRLKKLNFN